MNADDYEDRMRKFEQYHTLSVPPDSWIVIRVDGRGFTKRATEWKLRRPFDLGFKDAMVSTAKALVEELQGLYAYAESDEISVLLPSGSDLFSRELEKLVSISASVAAARFTTEMSSLLRQRYEIMDPEAHFDSRLWVGPSPAHVADYFRWRQADAARCCLNSHVHWKLIAEGKTPGEAHEASYKATTEWKNEFLFQRDTNFNDLPLWQRRGIGVGYQLYPKVGRDPRTDTAVTTYRRRLAVDEELPMGEDYSRYIAAVIDLWLNRKEI